MTIRKICTARKLSRILKDYQHSGALNALVGLHAAVDDQTFLTKRGDLVTVLGIQGADYRDVFHLNETEAQWITRLVPKRQMLVKRPDVSKVLNLNVDRKDFWRYTSNPYDRAQRREAFERYGFEEGLNILARSDPT